MITVQLGVVLGQLLTQISPEMLQYYYTDDNLL